MARVRDREGFAELSARCAASGAGATMTKSILRRAATILAAKGGLIARHHRRGLPGTGGTAGRRGCGARTGAQASTHALHSMGVFGADAPSTLRAFATQGQLSPEQMLQPLRHRMRSRSGSC